MEQIKDWWVYMLECSDGTLYTGISNNVKKRLEIHNIGKGAKYTKPRLPVKIVYFEKYLNRSEASKREYDIKQLDRIEKRLMIKNFINK